MGVERYSAAVPTARGRSVIRCLLCAWLALLAGTGALAIHLRGDLYATLAVNLFAHRSSAVGDLGLKTELQAGLGYTWNDKWF